MFSKKTIRVCIIGIVLLTLTSMTSASEIKNQSFSEKEVTKMKQTKAIIHTQFGDIHISFFPEVAPNHVHNFIDLAKSKFYNGTTFHRVIPGFMIQGGDPNSKSKDRTKHGTGDPGYRLKAEFNSYPHRRGILSMARSAHPDSAGSQFFVCVADARFLDKQYTVFGKVDKGMSVADKIVSQKRDRRDNPIARIEMTVEIVDPVIKVEEPDIKKDKKQDPPLKK
jgi:peptidyl-prolyl cis-trans isomerase B (cyclophilin B)